MLNKCYIFIISVFSPEVLSAGDELSLPIIIHQPAKLFTDHLLNLGTPLRKCLNQLTTLLEVSQLVEQALILWVATSYHSAKKISQPILS